MATLRDYYSELMGMIPRLDVFTAKKLVQRAWEDVQSTREWSWNVIETVILTPALVQAGTVSVTQYSATVTLSAAAQTAWIASENVQFPVIRRQFRTSSSGPIYNIISWDGASTVTLDRVYMDSTNATSQYQLYRCYISVPTTFQRWMSVYDPANSYYLRDAMTKLELDQRDPTRSSSGDPKYIVPYKAHSDDTQLYELWPHPVTAKGLQAFYVRLHSLSLDTDTLPPTIDPEVLTDRMYYRGYLWAEGHKGRFPELRLTNWAYMATAARRDAEEKLIRAKRRDEDLAPMNVISRPWDRFLGPIDAAFAQSHDVDW